MRTDVTVGGKAALAVVLSDVDVLTYPVHVIRKAVTSGKYGQSAISKDFLQPGENSTTVKRGEHSRRRRCTIIFLDKIDQSDCEKLRRCKCLAWQGGSSALVYSLKCT